MSEPQSDHDLLIEIKTLVKSLTDTVTGYGKDIRTHDGTLIDHGNRIVALETRAKADDNHHDRSISARAAFWTAVGSIVLLISVLVTLWVQHR